MTTKQSALATELANITNSLRAMEIISQLKDQTAQTPAIVQKQVESFTVTFEDGTQQKFVKEQPTVTAAEVLQKLRERAVKMKYADDILPAKVHTHPGFRCTINGVNYNSIMHASRILNICRHRVKANLDSNLTGWNYV